jgi:photosystem II stability/assembly factor-like uncharacterized protein
MKRLLLLLAVSSLLFINQSKAQGSPWITQNSGLAAAPWYDVRLAAVSNTVCWGLHFRTGSQYTRTTDGGAQWTAGTIPGAPASWRGSGITALDANTAWVLMHNPSSDTSGGVFKTTNGGASWTRQTTAFPGTGGFPKIVHFFDANVGLCVGDANGGYWEIYRTTNGGLQWTRIDSVNIPLPDAGETTFPFGGSASNSFWFSGGDGGFSFWHLYRTTDRGLTWVRRGPGGGTRFPTFASTTHGICAGWLPSQQMRRTTDGGDTWSTEDMSFLPFTPLLFGYVPGTVGSYVLTNGERPGFGSTAGCAYTTNGGDTWNNVDLLVSRGLSSFASPTTGWAPGDNGVVYKWNSNLLVPPSPWIVQHTGLPAVTQNPEIFVNAVNDNVCWVIESQNALYSKTTNGGATWSASIVAGAAGLRGSGIMALDGSTAWAVMNDPSSVTSGGIYKTTNAGAGWTRQTAFEGAGGYPNFVYFFDANNGVAMGDPRGGYWEIYTSTNGGSPWTRVPSINIPSPSSGEWGIEDGYRASGNYIWFINNLGSLYRSTNRGYTWTVTHNVSNGAFAFGFKDSLNGLSIGNPFKRTTDGGTTWISFVPASYPSGLGNALLGVVPGSRSWVISSPFSGSSGSAYSTDDGNNWIRADAALHGRTRFTSDTVGWSAGVNDTIYKWTGRLLVDPSTSVKQTDEVVQNFGLEQNYPNPFNPATKIQFALPVNATVSLKIYNLLGQEVATLVDESRQAGYHEMQWNGRNQYGSQVATGVYFYRIEAKPSDGAAPFTSVKKMVLVK